MEICFMYENTYDISKYDNKFCVENIYTVIFMVKINNSIDNWHVI